MLNSDSLFLCNLWKITFLDINKSWQILTNLQLYSVVMFSYQEKNIYKLNSAQILIL